MMDMVMAAVTVVEETMMEPRSSSSSSSQSLSSSSSCLLQMVSVISTLPDHDGYGYGSGYGGGGDNGGVTMEPGDLEAAGKSKKYFSLNMIENGLAQ